MRNDYAIIASVRILLTLALPLTAGCSYSLQSDIVDARADIKELQGKIPPESPLWIFEGPDRFDAFVTDYDLGVPDFLYHHLLRRLNSMTDEEVDGMVKGEFDLDECSRDKIGIVPMIMVAQNCNLRHVFPLCDHIRTGFGVPRPIETVGLADRVRNEVPGQHK